jgi:pimeloyl-ACP methyl ester carboxylesterase
MIRRNLAVLGKWATPFIASGNGYLALKSAFPNDFCNSKIRVDAGSDGYELPIPFFVIQGRDDNRTSPDAARAFVNQVRAPAKGYSAIDGGHFACLSNPIGFLNALDSDMRSLRIARSEYNTGERLLAED